MRSGDVNGEIKAHLEEAVVDGWGGKNAGASIFDTESLAGGGEVLEDPFGGLAGVAGEEDFDIIAGIIDKAFYDAS